MDNNKQAWKNSVLINPISVVLRDTKDGTGKSESHIDLQNRSQLSILFKVKTTDPANYIVRPNQGIILTDATMNIRIQCMLHI